MNIANKDDQEVKEMVERRLREIEAIYGRMPLIPQVLSERPDLFIPYADYSDVAVQKTRHLDRKTAELAAVAAGSALASPHCLSMHIEAAFQSGADRDEVLEAIVLGGFMAMTMSHAVSLRMFQETEGRKAPQAQG